MDILWCSIDSSNDTNYHTIPMIIGYGYPPIISLNLVIPPKGLQKEIPKAKNGIPKQKAQ